MRCIATIFGLHLCVFARGAVVDDLALLECARTVFDAKANNVWYEEEVTSAFEELERGQYAQAAGKFEKLLMKKRGPSWNPATFERWEMFFERLSVHVLSKCGGLNRADLLQLIWEDFPKFNAEGTTEIQFSSSIIAPPRLSMNARGSPYITTEFKVAHDLLQVRYIKSRVNELGKIAGCGPENPQLPSTCDFLDNIMRGLTFVEQGFAKFRDTVLASAGIPLLPPETCAPKVESIHQMFLAGARAQNAASWMFNTRWLANGPCSWAEALHLEDPKCPRRMGSTLSYGVDWKAKDEAYKAMERENSLYGGEPAVLVVDGVLSAWALARLRNLALEGTIWYEAKPVGYLGSYFDDGLAADSIWAEVSSEFKQVLPRTLEGHELLYAWAYKYDNRHRDLPFEYSRIPWHIDEAAVNINLWVTDDSCNPAREAHPAGLEIALKHPPDGEGTFLEWNSWSMSGFINAWLEKSNVSSFIAYHKQNRAVIFDSGLLHRSQINQFHASYECTRINFTFLFGQYRGIRAKAPGLGIFSGGISAKWKDADGAL